jgi:processing peptidase subunit beta
MEQLGKELDALSGSVSTEVTRETTSYTITFPHDKLEQAVNYLGEILINSTFDEQQVEAEKDSIHKSSICTKDLKTAAMEAIHYTSFRDHFLGQPVRGIRENIHNITADQVRNFHRQHYVGSNIVVSAAGNVDIKRLTDLVNNTFGKLPQTSAGEVANSSQPYFTPSVMFMRDDEIPNTSAAIAFRAPGYTDPDFYGMRVPSTALFSCSSALSASIASISSLELT